MIKYKAITANHDEINERLYELMTSDKIAKDKTGIEMFEINVIPDADMVTLVYAVKVKKQPKQPKRKDLASKAQEHNMTVLRGGKGYQIVDAHTEKEVIYTCATLRGIQRKLTQIINQKLMENYERRMQACLDR